jgi:hypothetical protein
MVREIKCAQSLSGGSDASRIVFINPAGDTVSYYCLNNQLLRRENGGASPLASNITSISFSYSTGDGMAIDPVEQPGSVALITVYIIAEKPGYQTEPVTVMQKISLPVSP